MRSVPETATIGTEFASALAAKDFERIRGLLGSELDFKGLTPRRNWEAGNPEEVISGVLRQWFEDSDEIEAVERLEADAFADRERVGYRFRVRNPEGVFLVEQQVYLSVSEGQVTWMRVLCSGFRPVDPE